MQSVYFYLSIQMCTGEKMTIKSAMINPSEPGQQELLPSQLKPMQPSMYFEKSLAAFGYQLHKNYL